MNNELDIQEIKRVIEEVVVEWDYEGEDLEEMSIAYDKDETKVIEFATVEEGKWDDEGKYQYQDNIFQVLLTDENRENYTNTDVFYRQSVDRSGSYFSHYEYTYSKPVQVELHEYEKTITVREWTEV